MKFLEKLELEQLREIETQFGQAVRCEDVPAAATFEQWLLQRVSVFKKDSNHQKLLLVAPVFFGRARISLIVLGLLLGIISGSGLLSANQQYINIFWLLGALLGAHTVSLIFWLVMSISQNAQTAGPLSLLWDICISRMLSRGGRGSKDSAASIGWWRGMVDPPHGKWLLATLSHLFWLAFIFGCSFGLMFVFATQQFDFIWESTLLSKNHLEYLVSLLSMPFSVLGFNPPVFDGSDEAVRRSWALFVLLAFIGYGFIPRLIALLVGFLFFKHSERNWLPDWSLDYFVDLQFDYRRLNELSRVIDKDDHPENKSLKGIAFSQAEVPSDAHYFGLEVDPKKEWKNTFKNFKGFLNDQKSVEVFCGQPNSENQQRAIFVDAHRVVDRGLTRKLTQLKSTLSWLVVYSCGQASPEKVKAWLEASEKAGWNPERVVLRKGDL